MHVDYHRITDEAYEGKDDGEGAWRDRTLVAGMILLSALALMGVTAFLVLLCDLSHRGVLQLLSDGVHDVALRFEGL